MQVVGQRKEPHAGFLVISRIVQHVTAEPQRPIEGDQIAQALPTREERQRCVLVRGEGCNIVGAGQGVRSPERHFKGDVFGN